MRRFYIESPELSREAPVITGDDADHIRNVLRLRPGDNVELIDGTGWECESRIVRIVPGEVHVSVVHRRFQKLPSFPRLIIAQALLKDNKLDDVIRQITELGIQEWVPYMAERSVPVLDAKRWAARKKRWGKIAIESLKQCERSTLVTIAELMTFQDMLAYGASSDVRLIFWENESPSQLIEFSDVEGAVQSVFAILGPEGGFAAHEISAARSSGFKTVSLGPRVLKADTAALAVSTLLQYGYGDMRSRMIPSCCP